MDAEVATEGKARCDLPGYEKWYYSTGNLYRKTSSARSGMSQEQFKEVYREAFLIEALRPSYLEYMNMTYDNGNHSLVLSKLGVPSYAHASDKRNSGIHYYYYEFFADLAKRNERQVEEVLADFAGCYLSVCNDDCHRGTNEDLRGCTDIVPAMRADIVSAPDTTESVDTANENGDEATTAAPEATSAAPGANLVGIKHMMRSCWTRGGAMCSEECLAVQNETWTCLENQGSCRRFMDYF